MSISLFVIDDSSGTADKQKALVAGFPSLTKALQANAGRLPNLRVGVVSSNLGAPASRLAECAASDRALLQSPAAGCESAAAGPMLESLEGGTRNNFSGTIADAFGCVGRAGEHRLRLRATPGLCPARAGRQSTTRERGLSALECAAGAGGAGR